MFFGRRGDAGFIGSLLGACSGVVGFNVAMLSRLVRDIFRPARHDVGAGAKKFAQHTKNGPKWVLYGALGELLRGNAAGGAVRGEFFHGPALAGPRRASLLRRTPGSRAHLLAPLTPQCAAKPHWWHGGQPAQAATYRVNVRIKGAHVRRMRSQKQKMDLKGSQASRRSPCLPRDDRGETPKGPAPRCVR